MQAFNSEDIERLERAVGQIVYLSTEGVIFSKDEVIKLNNLARALTSAVEDFSEGE